MGGKGGGGGGEPGWMPYWRADQERIAKEKAEADAAEEARKLAEAAKIPEAEPEPEPEPEAEVVVEEEKPVEAIGPPIDAGGAITQPDAADNTLGAGDALGGAIINPPDYWVGGTDSYDKTKGGKGKLTTTQT